MILTCPQCTTRYLLPAQSLAPDGRRVKCSNCAELWFQLPDPDELAEYAGEKIEDIPEGVKPIPEGSALPALPDEEYQEYSYPSETTIGYMAAAGVFALTFAVLLALHQPVVTAWPASAAFYEVLGMKMPVAGEGLVFDNLTAKAALEETGEEKIILEGRIINLTKNTQKVPMIEASLRSPEGKILERWIIAPPQDSVKGEKSLSFSKAYNSKGNAENINVRFILDAAVKTDAAAADNIQARHPGDPAPPHGGATGEESPAPSSAHPDPGS